MRLAFCLFKYSPYSGLARDCLRIAQLCFRRGHSVKIYAAQWHGVIPVEIEVKIISSKHWLNHLQNKKFITNLLPILQTEAFEKIIGFNKMPGLDLYYAADPCFIEQFSTHKKIFNRLLGRYKYYSACENAVFGRSSNTVSLLLTAKQIVIFKKYYQTPDERLHLLPPGIDKNRIRPDEALQIRDKFRKKFGLKAQDKMMLMIGTAFKTKGLDRSIKALQLLPDELKQRTYLYVVGEGNYQPFKRMAKRMRVAKNIKFFFGQDEVLPFLLAADCLLQPSYSETTGTAILEAIIVGLPVIASDICGYAFHIKKADVGQIVPTPFKIATFADLIQQTLNAPDLQRQLWIKSGVDYAQNQDLFSLPDKVVAFIECGA